MPPQPQQPSVLALTPETGASPCLDSDGATDTVRLVLPLPDGVVAGAPVADHQPAGKKRKKGKAAKESSSFEFHLDGDGEHGDPEPFLQALEEQQHLLQGHILAAERSIAESLEARNAAAERLRKLSRNQREQEDDTIIKFAKLLHYKQVRLRELQETHAAQPEGD
eukprot:m.202340 g.202340  ORF g.202340 m.202340 type:complete len:166 (-) comp21736_c0_seq1:232-729(-)